MNNRTWTVRDVIQWSAQDFAARRIESPRLDAELIVAKALETDRVGLYLDLDRPLIDGERAAVRALVTRRRAREPVAYILGYRDFFGRRFAVSEAVLVPRPDTETLVEQALRRIPKDAPCRVLDVGTGSGAIALTLAAERPHAEVVATDVSREALDVARSNAEALGLSSVRMEEADIVDPGERFDVIVSNPPYVTLAEHRTLEPEVREHEPSVALLGGPDGLDVIRSLLARTSEVAAADADLLIEVGSGQAPTVLDLGTRDPTWSSVGSYRDLRGIERVVHLRRT